MNNIKIKILLVVTKTTSSGVGKEQIDKLIQYIICQMMTDIVLKTMEKGERILED